MKVNAVKKQNIIQLMQKYRNDCILSALSGECKKAVESRREYAKLAVDNFELVANLKQPLKGSVPLFSKMGLNLVKYMFYNMFVKTTPEEKRLKVMSALHKQGKLDIYQ